ncbi:MAG: long-chain fatty acid--CoA ligase, partial [Bacteroidales bacterium]
MKQHIAHLLKSQVNKYGPGEFYRYKNNTSGNYESLSWDDVFADVQKVSKSLLVNGYGFESKIGIFSPNRPEWSITDYGILGTRGIVVPFFSSATKEQLKYIVDETRMELIFVGKEEQFEKAYWLFKNTSSLTTIVYFDESIKTTDERCFSWQEFIKQGDGEEQAIALEKTLNEALPEDLATILYTSGTTGEPKGVMLTHDNFMFCFGLHKKRLDITEKDVSMCFLPLSHIFERTWSFYMMHAGVVNIFLENPKEVINELPIANPSVMCAVPRFFEKTHEGIQKEYNKWAGYKQKIFDWSIKTGHAFSEYKSRNKPVPAGLSIKNKIAGKLVLRKLRNIFGHNIRAIPCSGAAIRPELLRFFHAIGLFVNYGYGATETTATVSCFKTDSYNFDTCGSIMPEIQVKISDGNEILVKGRTVFKGYYNKPEETDKVLQDGWYATGDEGSITDNGMLIMTDRLRDLFKTSVGKFVSPQKIELLIGQNKFVEQVIIFGDNKKYIS